eukprot:gnl/TRDRNA2_/TRDRNA2_200298_c0_seq1.p1 gnl/TRDRNA2_/TRDRNA2_200298_c0~~gnl/TRDRNA2_/TRDRNA2_200298_c0_seq1.p1  ORF type:complete len:354 (+),score=62.74 gnl/TRDRNA2_/TRDRNA2_200298_c0_seq1:41-1102(+)
MVDGTDNSPSAKRPKLTKPEPVLLISRSEINSLMTTADYIRCVEMCTRAQASGEIYPPAASHVDAKEGEFHIKSGGIAPKAGESFVAIKANGGFFGNMAKHGLPNIQGVIYLSSGDNGVPLAILDSAGITMGRTGAATAVAAQCLARPTSSVATIAGAGRQGRVQLLSLVATSLPLKRVYIYSRTAEKADALIAECKSSVPATVELLAVREGLATALAESDVVVTCTPSRQAFIRKEDIKAGTFLAAVGADSPGKQELDPALVASARVVTDVAEQCKRVGEVQHALRAGILQEDQLGPELCQVLSGAAVGRRSPDEVVIYDSTGTALQDAAAAAEVYRRARQAGKGTAFDFTA